MWLCLPKRQSTGNAMPAISICRNHRQTLTHADTKSGDHDFCLRQSCYTDNHLTSRKRAAGSNLQLSDQSCRLYWLSYHALGSEAEKQKKDKYGEQGCEATYPAMDG